MRPKKRLEPVTLVRSPMLMKLEAGEMSRGSSPDNARGFNLQLLC